MSKQNYTNMLVLLPKIKAKIAQGKTQQEVAERFGLKNKYVVKSS